MRRQRRGTDDVLTNLGFPDADELSAKTILAKKINDILGHRGITQSEASKLLRLPQPKISAIGNYKLRGISLERLMDALTALGQNVEITVRLSAANWQRASPWRLSWIHSKRNFGAHGRT